MNQGLNYGQHGIERLNDDDPGAHTSDLKKMIDQLKAMCGYTSYKVSQYNIFRFGAKVHGTAKTLNENERCGVSGDHAHGHCGKLPAQAYMQIRRGQHPLEVARPCVCPHAYEYKPKNRTHTYTCINTHTHRSLCLFLRCASAWLYIRSAVEVTPPSKSVFMHSFNSSQAYKAQWRLSQDKQALTLPGEECSHSRIARQLDATQTNESPRSNAHSTADTSEPMLRLVISCSWVRGVRYLGV